MDLPPQPARPPVATRNNTTFLLVVILAMALLLVYREIGASIGNRPSGEARPVAARGDLAANELATIELFETASNSVAYVRPIQRVRGGIFSRDILEVSGTGSGFVWDQNGHIVTNFHVVQNASKFVVMLHDNTSYDATVVGVAPEKDIAVLKIDAPADLLLPIAVGTSHDLRVGQSVFAIGNPFGLDYTLTTGVVSALNREIKAVNGRTIRNVIQTDAAINPGNSGGPLLDSACRLIGMNTSIFSPSGASAGVGFAVPVDTINRLVPQLIKYGKVIRPGLGIEVLSDDLARRIGVQGVPIMQVHPNSSAEEAGLNGMTETNRGLLLGDVIVQINETPTPTQIALLDAIDEYKIGDTVQVVVLRDDHRETIPVELQAIE